MFEAVFVLLPLRVPPLTPLLTEYNPEHWSFSFSNPEMVELIFEGENSLTNSIWGEGIRILKPGRVTIAATNNTTGNTYSFEVTCNESFTGAASILMPKETAYSPYDERCIAVDEPVQPVLEAGIGHVSDLVATRAHHIMRNVLCSFDDAVLSGDMSSLRDTLAGVNRMAFWIEEAERLHNAKLERIWRRGDPRLDSGGIEPLSAGEFYIMWGAPMLVDFNAEGTEVDREEFSVLRGDFVYEKDSVKLIDLQLIMPDGSVKP